MNQISAVGFGLDASVFAGYAQSANERLGNIDFIVENTGSYTLYMTLGQYDGNTAPSGFAKVGAAFVVVPGGVQTKSYSLLSKRIGFFGSGNTLTTLLGSAASTKANITAVLRNKADLRGAQIDMVATGRRGWSYDEGWNKLELKKKWGTVSNLGATTTQAGTGIINSSAEGV
jgi:hypothetical protein